MSSAEMHTVVVPPLALVAEPPRSTPIRVARALLRTARPKQWAKNVLVFAAPATAGVLTEVDQLGRSLVAFAALCLAASATYFVNDARDVEADRHHPRKRYRPVAAGIISPRTAWIAGILLAILALGVAAPFQGGRLTLLVAAYLCLTTAYSTRLKHEPVLDLATVAAGFVLRAVAGGIATGVPISDWFLIVAGAASLFIVTGKRIGEQVELGPESQEHRATLAMYSTAFLRYVAALSSGIAITAYCLWAFAQAEAGGGAAYRLSIVPFALAILRYAHIIELGQGGAPEDVLFSDRVLLVLGAVWAVTFAFGVYA